MHTRLSLEQLLILQQQSLTTAYSVQHAREWLSAFSRLHCCLSGKTLSCVLYTYQIKAIYLPSCALYASSISFPCLYVQAWILNQHVPRLGDSLLGIVGAHIHAAEPQHASKGNMLAIKTPLAQRPLNKITQLSKPKISRCPVSVRARFDSQSNRVTGDSLAS